MNWRILFFKNNKWKYLDYKTLFLARIARENLLKQYDNVVIEYIGNEKEGCL